MEGLSSREGVFGNQRSTTAKKSGGNVNLMIKPKSSIVPAGPSRAKSAPNQVDKKAADQGRATRETIESIAVAVILAFLFRAFVAEAFVIPTGSMAPTLQGRHMDVVCDQCGYQYRTGASLENDGPGEVIGTVCPMCQYTMMLEKNQNANHRSFSGDRILVSKFAYEIGQPTRWDVIVFKYPGNAKQNYIKRLVGMPNETIRIRHGDIYSRPTSAADLGDAGFQIARKSPSRLRAMLQLVYDTNYQSEALLQAGWPSRWQDWQSPTNPTWQALDDGRRFQVDSMSDTEAWLRYRHLLPDQQSWHEIQRGLVPSVVRDGQLRGQLITDYYAYNDGIERASPFVAGSRRQARGLHWVGDLALEAVVEVQSDRGELLLDLVEGGVHYTCRIDVATGQAILQIDGGQRSFVSDVGVSAAQPRASTRVRGPGRYRLMLSNCDDQLILWVNGRVVSFDGPTTYVPDADVRPQWSPDRPGDLEPAGIGSAGADLVVSRLQIYRDVYYVSSNSLSRIETDYQRSLDPLRDIQQVFESPELWNSTSLFDLRRPYIEFEMGEGQFFPLGDNSPQSKDARLWAPGGPDGWGDHPPPHVRRDLLTGKALLIYWPHPWNAPIPFLPNFQRMGLIR
jgi:signal peptidase I